MVIENNRYLFSPQDTEDYYQGLYDGVLGLTSWYDCDNDIFEVAESPMIDSLITEGIPLESYFSTQQELLENTIAAEAYSMIYGQKSLETLRGIFKEIKSFKEITY